MSPKLRGSAAIGQKCIKSGSREIKDYEPQKKKPKRMFRKYSSEPPTILLCPLYVCKPVPAWVTHMQDRVESPANSITHEVQQKIRILSCSKHGTGSRSKGLIKEERYLSLRAADKEAASTRSAEYVNRFQITLQLPPRVSADLPVLIFAAYAQNAIVVMFLEPLIYVEQGVRKVPAIIVWKGDYIAATVRNAKIPRSRDTGSATKVLYLNGATVLFVLQSKS